MRSSTSLVPQITRALVRARFGILSVAAAYLLSWGTGLAMVHEGSRFALTYRDRVVGGAVRSSHILRALDQGHPLAAAALDFGANSMASLATTVAGYWAPAVFPIVVYRGWIGGIVSVDGNHRSRLISSAERRYYLVTIFLQLVPYILAGGAGVNLGIARVRPVGDYAGPKWFGVPREAVQDAARLYLLVIPLFAVASFSEFMAIPR